MSEVAALESESDESSNGSVFFWVRPTRPAPSSSESTYCFLRRLGLEIDGDNRSLATMLFLLTCCCCCFFGDLAAVLLSLLEESESDPNTVFFLLFFPPKQPSSALSPTCFRRVGFRDSFLSTLPGESRLSSKLIFPVFRPTSHTWPRSFVV